MVVLKYILGKAEEEFFYIFSSFLIFRETFERNQNVESQNFP
jgi:hypothetical protein